MIRDEEIVPEELNSTTWAEIIIGAELFRSAVGRSEFVVENQTKKKKSMFW